MSKPWLPQEENLRRARKLRQWKKSGLISKDQEPRLAALLEPALPEAGLVFKILVFLFTCGVLAAGFELALWNSSNYALRPGAELAYGFLILGLLEVLLRSGRWLRQGLELGLGACFLGYASKGLRESQVFQSGLGWSHGDEAKLLFLILASYYLYRRMGHLVWLLVSLGSGACLIPLLEPGEFPSRFCQAIYGTLVAAVLLLRPGPGELERERSSLIRALGVLLAYGALNLRLENLTEFGPVPSFGGRFTAPQYWFCFAASLVLPLLILLLGLGRRDKPLISSGIVTVVVSLMTMKLFLGIQRQTWDPAIFGLFLISVAWGLSRWLEKGLFGRRGAFTGREVLKASDQGLGDLALAAAGAMTRMKSGPSAAPGPEKPGHGGRSGGAGAKGNF